MLQYIKKTPRDTMKQIHTLSILLFVITLILPATCSAKTLQENSLTKAYPPKKKKVHTFSITKPHPDKTKGAIRGVSISFLVVSEERSAKYQLVSPPKGMKITQHIVGESCMTPYLGKGKSSGVVVKWDVPMDA